MENSKKRRKINQGEYLNVSEDESTSLSSKSELENYDDEYSSDDEIKNFENFELPVQIEKAISKIVDKRFNNETQNEEVLVLFKNLTPLESEWISVDSLRELNDPLVARKLTLFYKKMNQINKNENNNIPLCEIPEIETIIFSSNDFQFLYPDFFSRSLSDVSRGSWREEILFLVNKIIELKIDQIYYSTPFLKINDFRNCFNLNNNNNKIENTKLFIESPRWQQWLIDRFPEVIDLSTFQFLLSINYYSSFNCAIENLIKLIRSFEESFRNHLSDCQSHLIAARVLRRYIFNFIKNKNNKNNEEEKFDLDFIFDDGEDIGQKIDSILFSENKSKLNNDRKFNKPLFCVKWKNMSYCEFSWVPAEIIPSSIFDEFRNNFNLVSKFSSFENLKSKILNKSESDVIRKEIKIYSSLSKSAIDSQIDFVQKNKIKEENGFLKFSSEVASKYFNPKFYPKLSDFGKIEIKNNNNNNSTAHFIYSGKNIQPSGPATLAVSNPAAQKYEFCRRSLSLDRKKCSLKLINNKNNKELFSYQLAGVEWLLNLYDSGRNGILADEMGLGKTVTTVAYLQNLLMCGEIVRPCLIVAPLSTLGHWQKTILEWSDLKCLLFQDRNGKTGRNILKQNLFYYSIPVDVNSSEFEPIDFFFSSNLRNDENENNLKNKNQIINFKNPRLSFVPMLRFEVLLISYETLISEIEILKTINFSNLIIDEAQRLKSQFSKFISLVREIAVRRVLLLSGTPVQNRTDELWPLLNILEPVKMPSSESFRNEFGDLSNTNKYLSLIELLRPNILRRMKEEVHSSIPPLQEIIIELNLLPIQKVYYRSIYERNLPLLLNCNSKNSSHKTPSLLNLAMALRQCCNHPSQIIKSYQKVISDNLTEFKKNNKIENNDENKLSDLLSSSVKMTFLNKLLMRLKSEGRKVLIFSQFVKMLDIIQTYLELKKWKFERLDGSVSSSDRNSAIERFNKTTEDNKINKNKLNKNKINKNKINKNKLNKINYDNESDYVFVFLLTTKAGGVGINLTSADSVVLYDSDWNPQNDLQAIARAHRIGQDKEVKVFRLLTKDTYESCMFSSLSLKLGLSTALFNSSKFSTEDNSEVVDSRKPMSASEMSRLLRKGFFTCINDTKDEYSSENKNNLFYQQNELMMDDESIQNILSSSSRITKYKVAGSGGFFSKVEVHNEDVENQSIDVDDPSFWQKYLNQSTK